MSYSFEVEFMVRKGLGPDYVRKTVSIGYDDVDPDVTEESVKEWAKREAEQYLRQHDCPAFYFVDIYNS